jgi:DNA-binding transcriptional LysR family regulator
VSPELRHLRYFVAVAEERSYTRAAARLNVVQQTLSSSVQQLERELDVQLLIRDSHRVELTTAGRALLEHGRRALESVEYSWERARRAGRPATRELRVAHSPSVAPCTVPTLHDAVLERLPELRPSWWELWSGQVVQGVAAGRYQVGLARYPERVRQLSYETVAEEALALVVGAGHPLAAGDRVPLAALAGETILIFPREIAPGYHDALLRVFEDAGLAPRLRVAPDAGHAGIKLGLLARREVVAIAPLGIASSWQAASRAIALVALAEPAPRLPLHLCWNPRTATPAVQAFVSLVRELGRDGALVLAVASA